MLKSKERRYDGPEIRRIREQLGLTQEDLARELKITVSTVNRWENEHSKPSLLACLAITALLESQKSESSGKGA